MTDAPLGTGDGVAGGLSLSAAVAEVYAAPLAEFVAVRSAVVAAAKASGDRDLAGVLGTLRKPSVAAWAINACVREAPEVVEDLTDLGERMRDAQSRMDVAALQGMRGERDRLVDAFVQAVTQCAREADRALAAGAVDEVRATSVAALADAAAAQALASGALTRALSYSGFGEVDLSDAVVLTRTGRPLAVLTGKGAERRAGSEGEPVDVDVDDDGGARNAAVGDAAAAAATARAEALAALRDELASAEHELAQADRELGEAESRLESLRRDLGAAERQVEMVSKRRARLVRNRDAAHRAFTDAQ